MFIQKSLYSLFIVLLLIENAFCSYCFSNDCQYSDAERTNEIIITESNGIPENRCIIVDKGSTVTFLVNDEDKTKISIVGAKCIFVYKWICPRDPDPGNIIMVTEKANRIDIEMTESGSFPFYYVWKEKDYIVGNIYVDDECENALNPKDPIDDDKEPTEEPNGSSGCKKLMIYSVMINLLPMLALII